MAESDPKKIRPFGQSSDRRHLDSEEDPLVELARIVSEDSGFYGSRAERPKPKREEAIDRNAYSADLESELLQELESSFSRSTAPRVAPAAPRQAAQAQPLPPPVDDSDDLLRSIERQLGEFERRTQSTRSVAPAPPPQSSQAGWESASEQRDDEEYEPEPAPVIEPPRRSDLADRRVAEARERIGGVRPPERQRDAIGDRNAGRTAGAAETASDPRIGRLFVGSRDQARDEEPEVASRLPLRRRDSPPPAPAQDERPFAQLGSPTAAGAASGWDRIADEDRYAAPARDERDWRSVEHGSPSDLRPSLGAYDETDDAGYAPRNEPARREFVHEETPYAEERQPGYADPNFGGHWPDRDAAEQPGPDDDDNLAVVSADRLDESRDVPERRRSRAGLIAAAALLGVVVVGGAAAMYMRNGVEAPAGPPPVIAAAEGDVKVAPESQPAADGETVGDAVYNRVAGNAPPAEEQVVDGSEEPREISRIVLPSPAENGDQALARSVGEEGEGGAAPPAPAEAAGEVAPTEPNPGPRRVRTYVVRPDGTIAETSGTAAEGAPAPPPPEQQVAAVAAPEAEPMVPVRVPTTEIDGTGRPQAVQEEAAPPEPAPPSPPAQIAATEAAAPPAEASAPAPAAEAEAAPPAPAAEPPTTTAAVPAAEAPAPAAPVADGYVVQISSQRSRADAQASWSSAQRRFSSVLGNMEPNIQEADLGAKGTYYRVRVGPWASRGEAVQVCERLRAAGGDCIVTR